MSPEQAQNSSNETPKYSFKNAYDDLIELLTIEDFQTPVANEVMGRLLKSKIGETLIFFVGRNPDFLTLNSEIQGRIQPLVENIKLEKPSMEEYPIYLSLSEKVVSDVCAKFKTV